MIIASAIKIGDLVCFVPAPGRHKDVVSRLKSVFEKDAQRSRLGHAQQVDGFLTDQGQFLSRFDAFIHAQQCGQLLFARPNATPQAGLYSEDLWNSQPNESQYEQSPSNEPDQSGLRVDA